MDLLKEILNQIQLRLRFDSAVVSKLEDLEALCYALQEDVKLLKAHNQIQDEKLSKLHLVVKNGKSS